MVSHCQHQTVPHDPRPYREHKTTRTLKQIIRQKQAIVKRKGQRWILAFKKDGSARQVTQCSSMPPNEWKLEQGMDPIRMGLRNQSDLKIHTRSPYVAETNTAELREDADNHDDPTFVVEEERQGWRGYVEWEEYPDKKAKAQLRFSRYKFPPPPEFQLGPVPATNPVLEGVRWKLWHRAIGGALADVPERSWKTVLEEKHRDMLHLLQFPYNGEPPKSLLTKEAITPNKLHFVRNHGGIPDIDAEAFDLRLDGLVNQPKALKLAQLQDESLFPRSSKLVTIQCSGSRRVEQIAEFAGEGDEMINAPWAEGAIGTAKWTGVSLKKVIKHCGGLKDGAKHLELYGAETYFKGGECMNYVVSVPWSKVRANEVLLAWEMNDVPLPKIHGFPLRAVVMGYIGARSVKWLYRVKAIEMPSRAPVQSREYLYFQQQYGKHNQLPTLGIQIQEMPVSSAIMTPWHKEVVVHNGHLEVTGWAYSGGGRWPERVEVSSDGGRVWYAVPTENLSSKHKFAWRTWSVSIPCDHEGWTELVVRCWDNSLNTQPMEVRDSWNWGLHVTSSCHKVKIYSINASRPATRKRLEDFEKHGESFLPITRPTHFKTMGSEEYERQWAAMEPRDVDE